jgi:hypothetical protein
VRLDPAARENSPPRSGVKNPLRNAIERLWNQNQVYRQILKNPLFLLVDVNPAGMTVFVYFFAAIMVPNTNGWLSEVRAGSNLAEAQRLAASRSKRQHLV